MNNFSVIANIFTGTVIVVIGILLLFFTEKVIIFYSKYDSEKRTQKLKNRKYYPLIIKICGILALIMGFLEISFSIVAFL